MAAVLHSFPPCTSFSHGSSFLEAKGFPPKLYSGAKPNPILRRVRPKALQDTKETEAPCTSFSHGSSFLEAKGFPSKLYSGSKPNPILRRVRPKALQDTKETEASKSAEEVTEKFGLEAGLWKIFSSKDEGEDESKEKSKTDQAKELLTKYGGAYLATSISLSLISFSLCYVLVSVGIDVQSLLQKVGISTNETSQKVGTVALAYAAHKAASPIRFPPTVALTPIVANWIGGKKVKNENE